MGSQLAQGVEFAPARFHLLIADDEQDLLQLTSEVLSGMLPGWSVEAVPSAEAAVEASRRRVPTVLLTDYHMPNMDGVALAARLRGEGLQVPVILMTAFVNSALVGELRAAGLVHTIVRKPLDIDRLAATIQTLADTER